MTPRMEPLAGVIDGSNRLFTSSVPYTPNTTTVFVRGLARVKSDDDGWAEQSPTLGEILLNEAPLLGDPSPMMLYLDTSPTNLETEISTMSGVLHAKDIVSGEIEQTDDVVSPMTEVEQATGVIVDASMIGAIEAVGDVSGVKEDC